MLWPCRPDSRFQSESSRFRSNLDSLLLHYPLLLLVLSIPCLSPCTAHHGLPIECSPFVDKTCESKNEEERFNGYRKTATEKTVTRQLTMSTSTYVMHTNAYLNVKQLFNPTTKIALGFYDRRMTDGGYSSSLPRTHAAARHHALLPRAAAAPLRLAIATLCAPAYCRGEYAPVCVSFTLPW